MRWGPLIGVLATAGLGGCTSVYSRQPLFALADVADAPTLRTGIWVLGDPGGPCRPRPRAPISHWKGCEGWLLVRGQDIVTPDDEGGWTSTAHLIVSGAPPVWQLGPEEEEGGPRYVYFGLKPLARDAQDRVTRLEAWNALCGPPGAEVAKPDRPGARAAPKPDPATMLPGLVLGETGWDCRASDQAAVRRAVAYGAEHPEWRMSFDLNWVREARADDFARR